MKSMILQFIEIIKKNLQNYEILRKKKKKLTPPSNYSPGRF